MTVTAVSSTDTPHISFNKKQTRTSLIAVVLGNFLEWFDWTIYAIFTTYIAASFFHTENATSAVLLTLVVFAVGFLARPLGGLLFGWIGDKHGRKTALFISMMLMALGSALIGLMPTFAAIGVWASIGLAAARLLQGIAHGGETGGAYTYMAEIAPKNRRGLYSSFIMMTVTIGVMTATGLGVILTGLLSVEAMGSWGWRIPFFIGAALALFALWIRSRAEESPVYEEAKRIEGTHDGAPIVTASKRQLAIIALRIVLLGVLTQVLYYTWMGFFSSYAIGQKGMDPNGAYLASLGAQVIALIALPLWGVFSDRVGRRKSLAMWALAVMVIVFPISWILSDQPWTLFAAQAIALIVWAIQASIHSTVAAEQAPTAARARSVGIWSSVAAALTGGTAPYLNTWLSSMGLGWVFSLYIVFLAVVTLITLKYTPETAGLELNDIPLPGEEQKRPVAV